MIKPTETDKAYIAGIIDGEGCILLCEHQRLARRGRTPVIMPTISVVMNDPQSIKFMGERYRGRVKEYSRPGKRNYYRFDVAARKEVSEFLRDIYPYLTVKKRQADIMLDFLELPVYGGGSHHEVPAEQVFVRRVLVADMHAANQRKV